LRDFGIPGKILHTPGHTQGSISLLLDDGSAFVGDVAMNYFRLLGLKKRPLVAENYEAVFKSWEKLLSAGDFRLLGLKKRPLVAENYEGVFKSWEKLLSAGAKRIFPSHGEPFSASELEIALQLFSKNNYFFWNRRRRTEFGIGNPIRGFFRKV